MKKINFVIIAISSLIILASALLLSNFSATNKNIVNISDKSSYGEFILTIDYGNGNSDNYRLEFLSESTVFSLLQELSEKEDIELKTNLYPGMGIFVESIGGVSGGDNGMWWQYWVNETPGEVSADMKKINPGDVIRWKLDDSLF